MGEQALRRRLQRRLRRLRQPRRPLPPGLLRRAPPPHRERDADASPAFPLEAPGNAKRAAPEGRPFLDRWISYWIDEPIELNLVDALPPRKLTAPMQTTAIRPTRRAYSTSDAPFSSCAKRARRYGATTFCQ